jgi:hypothetical protein
VGIMSLAVSRTHQQIERTAKLPKREGVFVCFNPRAQWRARQRKKERMEEA